MSIAHGMPAPSRRPLLSERSFREGHGAWLRGDLDRAVAMLEGSMLEAPKSPDPRLFLARALAERKETARGLSVIDEAIALDPGGESGPLFRAIILLDAGDPGAGEALAGTTRSYLGAALLALHESADADAPLVLPAPARWIPDASARLLARLEARLHAGGAEGWIDAHHSAYAGDTEEPGSKKTKEAKKPEKPIASAKAWWRAIDAGFARKNYRRVIELHDSGEKSWRDLSPSVLHLFSLIATGEEGKAQRLARELGREHPASADLHFLEGLALVPSGRTVEAAWCFARAARFEDVEVDEITASVARKLGIEIRWSV